MANISATRQAQSAKQALSRAFSLEQELRVAAKQRSLLSPELCSLRAKLRDEYTNVLLSDYELSKSKDVEGGLWKSVFYKPIEELRKRIKKAYESGPSGQQLLDKATTTLLKFIEEAVAFYKHLILRLQASYKDVGVKMDLPNGATRPPLLHGSGTSKSVDPSASVARSLLFLGDLSRYSALYSTGLGTNMRSVNWALAAKHYREASRVFPDGGQPHNQLAVLATYAEDEIGAVYHYARALATEFPFLTARENLVLLFEKSRQAAMHLEAPDRRGPGRGRGRGARANATGPKGGISDARTMLTRYVRSVGILFTKTSLELLPQISSAAAADLEAVLRARPAEQGRQAGRDPLPQQLTKLAAVLSFSVHNTQWAPEGHTLGYSEMVQRSALLRGALTLMFAFLARLARSVSRVLSSADDPTATPRALPALRVGVHWLVANPEYCSPKDPDSAEVAARAQFLCSCAELVRSLRSGGIASAEGPLRALPEDSELRGFQPLARQLRAMTFPAVESPGERAAQLLRLLGDVARAASPSEWQPGPAMRGSARGLQHTKEWREMVRACEEFAASFVAPAEAEPGSSAPGPAESSDGGAQDDPLVEVAAELTAEDGAAMGNGCRGNGGEEEEDEEEELILLRPQQPPPVPPRKEDRAVGRSAAAGLAPEGRGLPLLAQAEAHQAQHYALPHMQGIQWGLGTGSADKAKDAGRRSASDPDPMQDMGNSLVASLGLENEDLKADRAPAPSAAAFPGNPAPPPVSAALYGSSLFSSPAPGYENGSVHRLSSYSSMFSGGSLFSAGGDQGGPSAAAAGQKEVAVAAPPPAAAPHPGKPILSGLGEGYGWLEALEAQQDWQAGRSNAVGDVNGTIIPPRPPPFKTSNPFVS